MGENLKKTEVNTSLETSNTKNLKDVIDISLSDGYITDEEVKNILQAYDQKRGEINSISQNDRELVDKLIKENREIGKNILRNTILEISKDGAIKKDELFNLFKIYNNNEYLLSGENRLEINNLIREVFIDMLMEFRASGITIKNINELETLKTMFSIYLVDYKLDSKYENIYGAISKGSKVTFNIHSGIIKTDYEKDNTIDKGKAYLKLDKLKKVIQSFDK